MILAIRTDQPEAMVAALDEQGNVAKEKRWLAGRRLSNELLGEIDGLVGPAGWATVSGVVVFEGPGSFTGLRIGITTANAIAYARNIPVAGARGDDWLRSGHRSLATTKPGQLVRPHYGAEPNISKPK